MQGWARHSVKQMSRQDTQEPPALTTIVSSGDHDRPTYGAALPEDLLLARSPHLSDGVKGKNHCDVCGH